MLKVLLAENMQKTNKLVDSQIKNAEEWEVNKNKNNVGVNPLTYDFTCEGIHKTFTQIRKIFPNF